MRRPDKDMAATLTGRQLGEKQIGTNNKQKQFRQCHFQQPECSLSVVLSTKCLNCRRVDTALSGRHSMQVYMRRFWIVSDQTESTNKREAVVLFKSSAFAVGRRGPVRLWAAEPARQAVKTSSSTPTEGWPATPRLPWEAGRFRESGWWTGGPHAAAPSAVGLCAPLSP